ncbi:sur7 protein [Apiospora aurea]|uniref:Sur7 protein n=1 Tax=Apiospora aurea TaxID=335848 RepID=A0ABR1QK82_9PEZI
MRSRGLNKSTGRAFVLCPLLFSAAAFALALVALFAGSKPGQMEDYHIISINMSNFGHDLVPTPTSGGSDPTSTDDGGIGGFFSSVVATIESSVSDELNKISNDIADKLSAEIGISQWYSLHVMNACEGNYAPNATSPGAWFNQTNCTAQEAGFQFNLSSVLDREIEVGPLDLNPADLKIPEGIQEAINYLNGFLLAIFALYVIGIGFSGIVFLLCIGALTIGPSTLFSVASAITATLAALALGIASAISTAIAKKGASEINDKGDDVGISAKAGGKFMIITWVAFGSIVVALISWIGIWLKNRRSGVPRKQHRSDKERASYDAHASRV